MADPLGLGLLLLLGSWAALDGTAVGQFMISRPLVSGTVAGWILGDPYAGFLVGAVLEGAHLGGLPVGGARLPEPGPAAIPAVALAIGLGGAGGMAAGAALGSLLSLVGGATVIGQRRVNGWVMRGIWEGKTTPGDLAARHWVCIALDGVRGAGLTAVGVGISALIVSRIDPSVWGLSTPHTVALLVLPGALSAGALLRAWNFPRHRRALLALGLLGGAALAASL